MKLKVAGSGKNAAELELSAGTFGHEFNQALVHQVVVRDDVRGESAPCVIQRVGGAVHQARAAAVESAAGIPFNR